MPRVLLIGDFRKVWETACAKSGLAGLLFHDLRRVGDPESSPRERAETGGYEDFWSQNSQRVRSLRNRERATAYGGNAETAEVPGRRGARKPAGSRRVPCLDCPVGVRELNSVSF